MKNKIQKFAPLFFIFVIVVNVYIWAEYLRPVDNNLHFYMLDVGQGDALLIKTPYNQDILIDGGPGKTVLGELGRVMPFYDRHIDLIILTHPHRDHLEGLISVMERYSVGRILLTGTSYESSDYEELLELVAEKEISISIAKKGQVITFGDDLSLDILAPVNLNGGKIENLNNSSIVGLLDFRDFEILLSGDAEVEEWSSILSQGLDMDIEILKAAHHGSENGTSRKILEMFIPEVALISAGEDNKYGHPHDEVLDLLKEFEIDVYRTDIEGTVHIISDGESYQIK